MSITKHKNGLFSINGRLSHSDFRAGDPKYGDTYKYLLINDQNISNVIVPHPLQKYLHSDTESEFYFTACKNLNILIAVRYEEATKYANTVKHNKLINLVHILPLGFFLFCLLIAIEERSLLLFTAAIIGPCALYAVLLPLIKLNKLSSTINDAITKAKSLLGNS